MVLYILKIWQYSRKFPKELHQYPEIQVIQNLKMFFNAIARPIDVLPQLVENLKIQLNFSKDTPLIIIKVLYYPHVLVFLNLMTSIIIVSVNII